MVVTMMTMRDIKRTQDITARGNFPEIKGRPIVTAEDHQELLPGIPDELTMAQICPRLSWRMLHNLAAVSRGWLRALQHGEIFEARVSARSTETLFVLWIDRIEALRFALYSMADNFAYSLPPIPGFGSTASRWSFTHTSVNGKLYVIGSVSAKTSSSRPEVWQPFMYVYDLARHTEWRRCATTTFVYKPDESAVMNGKIFVCGETETVRQTCEFRCAVYDPDADVWSPITNDTNGAHQMHISGIQEDLLYGYGRIVDVDVQLPGWIQNFRFISSYRWVPYFSSVGADIRTAVQGVKSGEAILVVIIDGRFLKMSQQGLDVYDSHTNTWTPVHFDGLFEINGKNGPLFKSPLEVCNIGVVVVREKNVIYLLAERKGGGRIPKVGGKFCLMRSEIVPKGNDEVPVQACEWQENAQKQHGDARAQWHQLTCSIRLCERTPRSCIYYMLGLTPNPFATSFLRCPVQL